MLDAIGQRIALRGDRHQLIEPHAAVLVLRPEVADDLAARRRRIDFGRAAAEAFADPVAASQPRSATLAAGAATPSTRLRVSAADSDDAASAIASANRFRGLVIDSDASLTRCRCGPA